MVIFTTDPVYSVPRQKNINPDKEEICQSDCLKGREDGLQRGYTGNWRANKKTDLFLGFFWENSAVELILCNLWARLCW